MPSLYLSILLFFWKVTPLVFLLSSAPSVSFTIPLSSPYTSFLVYVSFIVMWPCCAIQHYNHQRPLYSDKSYNTFWATRALKSIPLTQVWSGLLKVVFGLPCFLFSSRVQNSVSFVMFYALRRFYMFCLNSQDTFSLICRLFLMLVTIHSNLSAL